jgi:hypothetical protein
VYVGLYAVFPIGLLLSGFPNKILYAFLVHATCSANLTLRYLVFSTKSKRPRYKTVVVHNDFSVGCANGNRNEK